MRIFNRQFPIKDLVSRGRMTMLTVTRVISLFENPFGIIRHYFRGSTPDEKFVQLKKNGYRISFSSHRHDLITTLIIFARKDYGAVKPGSVVVDIGANIGIFSLFCAYCGAKSVYAIEPNSESFETLNKNIHSNNLGAIIKPIKAAVSDKSDEKVLIPIQSSPYNAVREDITTSNNSDYETISTKTLEAIIQQNNIDVVDLLKIDCEGHEFRIVPALSSSTLAKIKEIKMEYQGGDIEVILQHLHQNAFQVVKHEKDERFNAGLLWLSK